MNAPAANEAVTSTAGTAGKTSAPAPAAAAPPPVPDFDLLRRIGGGAYGEVWLARSQATGVLRAVKIVYRASFTDDRPFNREFDGLRRFEALSRSHPSQLALFHVGRNDTADCFFYVMELADGTDRRVFSNPYSAASGATGDGQPLQTEQWKLDAYQPHTLRSDLEHGRLPAARVIQIGLALTEALAHLHGHGLVHRDVKPSNIIFVEGRLKLADIGLVTDTGDSRSIVGTEGYLAPEGPGRPPADLFALGKVLYEAATGLDRRKFPDLPSSLKDWPDATGVLELNEILLRACTADTRQRYRSAEEMRADLEVLRRGESVRRQRAVERRVALAKIIGIVAGMIVSLLSVAGWLAAHESEQKHVRRQQAHQHYLEGKQRAERLTKDEFSKAVEFYFQAIAIDPSYAPPYVGLAETHIAASGLHLRPKEAMGQAKWAIRKALELDDRSPAPHAWLGMVKKGYDWDWAGAEAEFERAIEVAPHDTIGYYGLANYLAWMGRFDEADAIRARGQRLAQVPSHRNDYDVGLLLFFRRRYDEAIAQAHAALARDTNSVLNRSLLIDCFLMTERYPEAIAEAQTLRALDDSPWLISELGHVYGVTGQTNEARQCLAELERLSRLRYVSPYFSGFIHLGLGKKEAALDSLEAAYEERFGWLGNLKVDPLWDGLRAEPRFTQLLIRLGLEK